jgi:anti-repressor protein
MNKLQQFEHGGHAIRTFLVNEEPVVSSADLLTMLGLGRSSIALLDDDEKGVHTVDTLGGPQSVSFVTESGMYSLILRSRKKEAKAVRRWLVHEVLPEIRATGAYNAPAAHYQLPQSFSEALRLAANAHEQLEAAAPKVEAYDAFMDATGLLSMQSAAKALEMGPNVMYRKLRNLGILQGNNTPYQRYLHHFEVKLGSYQNRRGETVPTTTTMVRPAGLDFLRRKLKKAEEQAMVAAGSMSQGGGSRQ